MDQALIVRIRERAYHIWAANGGDAEQNWLRAEAEILNSSAAQSAEAAPQKKEAKPFQAEREEKGFGWLTVAQRSIRSIGCWN
jgi:DUF2934 family protein